jgi:transcriptional regulator with XRE-family HTH domain
MNDTQLGATFRAVRIYLHLRQGDVARRSRVSQSSVSRIERGLFGTLPLSTLRAVAKTLEMGLDTTPSWRGGDLWRLVNARHSALHEQLAVRLLREPAWESAAEVSYSIFGERGVIDRLAFHANRRIVAVFEIKSDLADPAGLVAQLDKYRRLAPEIAHVRGWDAHRVSCWAIVADTDTNRRRLEAHRVLLRGALPAGGRTFAGWLRDPAEQVDGLAFISYPHAGTGTRCLSTIKRVRPLQPR